MQKKSVDIRDVAALAGVSVGSASRVINGFENVSTATRDKVQRAIEVLDYRPNHAARSLRSRTSKTIGCLFTDVANPLYAGVFRALEERLRSDGYMLLLANGLNDPEREIETLEMFGRRGMDGVIVAPGNERDPRVLAALAALRMPVVVLDRDMDTPRDAVLFDHARGMRDCVARLFALGHERIGLALWRAEIRPVRRRIEGYKAAYRAAGQALPDMVVLAASATSSVFAEVDALLKRPEPPTALIAQGTYTLHSTLQAIAANGLRVPEDISVIGIGDTDFARSHVPPISVVNVDLSQMAGKIAVMLQSRMADVDLAPRSEKVALVFTERQSVGPVRRMPAGLRRTAASR